MKLTPRCWGREGGKQRGAKADTGLLPLMMMAMPQQIAFHAMPAKKANAPNRLEREREGGGRSELALGKGEKS